MFFDIVIIGSGPVGMIFACKLESLGLKIAIIEKLPKKKIENPLIDGREISLTNNSINILKEIDVWTQIPKRFKSIIKEARVLDNNSKHSLNFKSNEINKEYLGYLIPNNIIKKYVYKKLKSINNITLFNDVECISINNYTNHSSIFLSNKKKIKTSLIIAADGRFSKVRSMMKISAFVNDFDKQMIVCRMKHQKSHQNIAYEFFYFNQTQASLPFINNQSSIITTESMNTTEPSLKELNKKDFDKKIQKNFKNYFGKMKLLGKRYYYPIVTTYSKKFVGKHFALIGDAAVGMHPATGHGFNLNLKGLQILTREIQSAIKYKINFNSQKILLTYQYKFHRLAVPLYLSTNGIVMLYNNATYPAKVARQISIRLVNKFKPIKQVFLNILQ